MTPLARTLALLLVGLVTASASAQSRTALIEQAVARLASEDVRIVSQAATDLGNLKATEAVASLITLLQSSRHLSVTEHQGASASTGLRVWFTFDARAAIVTSLGLIGDTSAVPALKDYLETPPSRRTVGGAAIAQALYLLSGQSFEYQEADGTRNRFAPSPLDVETVRARFRPDLTPSAGLTASLDIQATAPDGLYWLTDRHLVLTLTIVNHSSQRIEIDPSAERFFFSVVTGNGERVVTPANRLPSPQVIEGTAAIPPQSRLILRWTVASLRDSPLSRDWAGNVYVRCEYVHVQAAGRGASWRGDRLISNSIQQLYPGGSS